MYISQTDSTNSTLRTMLLEQNLPEGFMIRTDFQTSGKGQKGNSWEAEKGNNLLFSILLYPTQLAIEKYFIISQLVSIAIKNTLDKYADGFSVKWPNDIYYFDKKIGGILIENVIQGGRIKSMIIGIGLNINQKTFESDAPNPVSLIQITGKTTSKTRILTEIYERIMELYHEMDEATIGKIYSASLYRKNGFHLYNADGEEFKARIIKVYSDGKLELETSDGEIKGFYFKEVAFVNPPDRLIRSEG